MKTRHKAEKHHEASGDTPETAETAEQKAAAAAPAAEGKPATEPWNPENAPDSPRRRGILGLSRNKEGHELRWVRLDSVDRRKNQGYVLAKPEDFDATPDENGMIRRNELVLMVVPTEVYEKRRQEVAKITAEQSAAPKREFLRERAAASRKSGTDLSTGERDEE